MRSTPASPLGSSGRRGNRNHHTSIGAPKLRGVRPIAERTVDERPSQATVNAARSSLVSPAWSRYVTPTIRSPRLPRLASRTTPTTSALRNNRKVGSVSAAAATISRKSHCGTRAMC